MRAVGVPFAQIAAELGKTIVKNIVALGALQEATRLFPKETFLTAIRQALRDKCALIPLNEEAFASGVRGGRGGSGRVSGEAAAPRDGRRQRARRARAAAARRGAASATCMGRLSAS